MGMVAVEYAKARAGNDPRVSGDRFAFAEAVGVEQFLLDHCDGAGHRRGA